MCIHMLLWGDFYVVLCEQAIQAMHGKKYDRCPDQLLVKYAFKKQRNSKRYIRVGDEVKQYVR